MSALSVVNEREIQPMQLSIEQLHSLRTQHEEEVQELQSQLDQLTAARSRFVNAKLSLGEISSCSDDDFLYVPLSSSLYVPGRITDSNKVTVELGTGYFCEKTIPEAKDLIDRKVALINSSIQAIEKVGVNKKKNISQLTQIIQYKVALASQKK